jgi:Domain of unknown function (DUF4304)
VSERNAVQQAFDGWGRAAGFEKKSGSWYRLSDEVISVSNLQKSQYGPSYYFNQAFWLRQLGDERFPKDNKCHIRLRLGSLLGDDSDRLDQLLDMGYVMPDEDRVRELTGLLDARLLPVIERGESLRGLRALLDEGVFKAAAIRGPAQQVLATVA